MTPLVLFDLDGTLVDTTELILQSFAHAFDAHLPGCLPSRRDLVATFGRCFWNWPRTTALPTHAPSPTRCSPPTVTSSANTTTR